MRVFFLYSKISLKPIIFESVYIFGYSYSKRYFQSKSNQALVMYKLKKRADITAK